MIGERVATGVVQARPRKSLLDRLPAAPSIAGYQRLFALVGQSFLLRLAVALTLVFVAALLYLAQASQVSVDEFAINDLQQKQLNLASQNANLWAKASALQSLGRIETIATTKLHMASPDLQGIIWLSPVTPNIKVDRPRSVSTRQAIARSEPLAWMGGFVDFVRSQF